MAQSEREPGPNTLDGINLLKGLSKEARLRIEQRCAWRRYQAGESIVNYLDGSSDVYCIASGQAYVKIYSLQGKAVTFCDIGAGEVFGEIAAIDGAPRSASIEARTSCLVAAMTATTFRQLLEQEPALAMALLQYFAAKLRTLTTRVYEVSALAVGNRIQAEVLRLAMQAPRDGKSAYVACAPTHAEIASRISTHREAVTRELNRLARIGILERRGAGLLVKDVDRLAEMVQDATGE